MPSSPFSNWSTKSVRPNGEAEEIHQAHSLCAEAISGASFACSATVLPPSLIFLHNKSACKLWGTVRGTHSVMSQWSEVPRKEPTFRKSWLGDSKMLRDRPSDYVVSLRWIFIFCLKPKALLRLSHCSWHSGILTWESGTGDKATSSACAKAGDAARDPGHSDWGWQGVEVVSGPRVGVGKSVLQVEYAHHSTAPQQKRRARSAGNICQLFLMKESHSSNEKAEMKDRLRLGIKLRF